MPFTDRQVNALRPKKVRYEVREPGRSGLCLRISPHGEKIWAFRYRYAGDHRRLVFGTYPEVGVADVHLKLAEAKKKLHAGHDPNGDALLRTQPVRRQPTTEVLVDRYVEHAAKTMRPKTVKEDRRILHTEVLSVWPGRLAKDITRSDVMELLKGIEERGVYVMRNRVAGLLSRFFLFALDEGLIDASPAVQIRRLRKVSNEKVERARDRFLTKEEIQSFWHNLGNIPVTPSMRAALKWALVTGQRRGEVAGTPRAEIDDHSAVWAIPGTRTKNEQQQLLPLPDLALQVLQEADAVRVRPEPTRTNRKDRRPYDSTPSPWLFPSKRYGRPISAEAMTCAIVRHRSMLGIGDATVHDLRRTVATWMGEIGIAKDLIASILNHTPKGVTELHYNKATMIGQKRKAMERWGAWLERVIAGLPVRGEVVKLRGGA
ncbi:MAG: tyrosine-type recombinase/integrase [Nitrospira sp.]|nr:tyrosine-type recombinase/integrase [Nitrospira sp.]